MEMYTTRKYVCNYEDENGQGHRKVFDNFDKGIEFLKTIVHLPYEFYEYDELLDKER